MTKVLGLSISLTTLGLSGFDNKTGQYTLPSAVNSRSVRSSAMRGAHLLELHQYVSKWLSQKRYETLAITSPKYSISAKGFWEADQLARMIGVVIMSAAMLRTKVVEVPHEEVAKMATGRQTATREDYLLAASANGVVINGEYAAEAYWIMTLAMSREVR